MSYFISKTLQASSTWISLRHCQLNMPKGRSLSLLQESWFSILIYGDFTIWRCIIILKSFLLPLPHSSLLTYHISLHTLRKKKSCTDFHTFPPRSPHSFPSCVYLFFFHLLQPPWRLSYSAHIFYPLKLSSFYRIIPIRIQKKLLPFSSKQRQ